MGRTLTEMTIQKAQNTMEKRNEIIKKHQENGVIFINPDSCYVEESVTIGKNTVIEQNVMLQGATVIGEDCVIGMGCKLVNTKVGKNSELLSVVSIDAELGEEVLAGPFAYIRPGSKIGNGVKVGDFVEVKNSTIDDGTKIAHLTYVGDSDMGKRVNFGCGTVTVNYDGKNKHRCKIGDDVFLGCNTNLVAPVTVGDGAYTAAGSTITDEVPAKSLAIARARQINKQGWKDKRDR
ncbi:MAG: UDP-N-acetylglucosamine diphosphorylase/glucosamine-1-phosphate N-acetyltransferase [Clostridia bacterium]|nr:UDP-N-acetylglucosamine diphosphorylase/glucosamine-1-phosphate N-acetyltransferase [Clostridia bacterium]